MPYPSWTAGRGSAPGNGMASPFPPRRWLYLHGETDTFYHRVFLLEGVATVAFGIVVYFCLPDYPRSKRTEKWLTPREQEFVELRLASNAPKTSDASFTMKEALDTLKDPRLWSFMIMQVLMNIANFGMTWFQVGHLVYLTEFPWVPPLAALVANNSPIAHHHHKSRLRPPAQ